MKRLTRLQRILIVAVVCLSVLACVMLALRQNPISNLGYSAWTYIKYGLIEKPFTSAADSLKNFANLWHAHEDNVYLNEELARQRSYQTLYAQEYNKNLELQGLLEMKNALPEAVMITAEVISRPGQSWNETCTVSAGSASGVKENMLVVSSDGAVGLVKSVQDAVSIVQLLTSTDLPNDIAIQIDMEDGTTVMGVMRGYDPGTNEYEIVLYDNDKTILTGQLVSTSGQGGRYPAGIRIGSITRSYTSEDSAGVVYYASPVSNIGSFSYVSIFGEGTVAP